MPKRRRLSRSAEFERVYRQGRSKANRFVVLYTFPFSDGQSPSPSPSSVAASAGQSALPIPDEGPRLGLSVSRRVGNAVERSRVKRCLREAFWAEADRLPAGADYVIVARPEAGELAGREGTPGLQRALAELVDQLAPPPSSPS